MGVFIRLPHFQLFCSGVANFLPQIGRIGFSCSAAAFSAVSVTEVSVVSATALRSFHLPPSALSYTLSGATFEGIAPILVDYKISQHCP